LLTKLQGYEYTSYKVVQFINSAVIISDVQYKELIDDFINSMEDKVEDTKHRYWELLHTYEFTNDIPKSTLFVKLKDGISSKRRVQIADGIRSYNRSPTTLLFDFKEVEGHFDSAMLLFKLFGGLLSGISLIMSYFLVFISTS
jgi:hypothetical protein